MEYTINARNKIDAMKIVEILLANYYMVTIEHEIEIAETYHADRYDITFYKKPLEEET